MAYHCGECGAEFGDPEELQAHHGEVHGTRTRSEEPAIPHSAEEKPLPDETPAPEAQDVRHDRPGRRPDQPGEGGGAQD